MSSEAPSGARRAVTPMRRAIAEAMSASALVPQFTLERSADPSTADALRRAAGEEPRISIQDVLIAAAARALRVHPEVNASFLGDEIAVHDGVHVGLALELDDGLVSPAVLHADRLSLAEISRERVRLRDGARAGRLRGEELFGATFSISNLGPLGVERFRALVTPPQAAILAVGGGGGRLSLSLSCDHRVLDGAPAARFLATLVSGIEDPESLPW